jgi:hypothetical protein
VLLCVLGLKGHVCSVFLFCGAVMVRLVPSISLLLLYSSVFVRRRCSLSMSIVVVVAVWLSLFTYSAVNAQTEKAI